MERSKDSGLDGVKIITARTAKLNDKDSLLSWLAEHELPPAPESSSILPSERVSRFCEGVNQIPHVGKVLIGGYEQGLNLAILLTKRPPSPEEAIKGVDQDHRRLLELEWQLWRGEPPINSVTAPMSLNRNRSDSELLVLLTTPDTKYLGSLVP